MLPFDLDNLVKVLPIQNTDYYNSSDIRFLYFTTPSQARFQIFDTEEYFYANANEFKVDEKAYNECLESYQKIQIGDLLFVSNSTSKILELQYFLVLFKNEKYIECLALSKTDLSLQHMHLSWISASLSQKI
jgi:hypothetical protein